MDELEKLDILRERMNISYREARELLAECDGDLISALVRAEAKEDDGFKWTEKIVDKGGDVLDQVKGYISKGNHTRIRLKKDDKTVAEFPATVGVVGVLAALASSELAVLAGIGAVAAVAKNVSLEIQKDDGETKVIPLDFTRNKNKTGRHGSQNSQDDIDF